MSRLGFAACVVAILVGGAALRVAWLRADPPIRATAGIVWHDEGPWTHNARNRALWGVWRTDNWNPVFSMPTQAVLQTVGANAGSQVTAYWRRLVQLFESAGRRFAPSGGRVSSALPDGLPAQNKRAARTSIESAPRFAASFPSRQTVFLSPFPPRPTG